MKKEEFIKNAKDYLDNLKFSVIPVNKDKIPMIEWREFQKRFPTYEEIEKWSNFPDPELGIVTGAISDLTVVDVEKDGDGSFLPQNTLIVETGGGGAHFYFKYREDLRNKARVMDLVDIRSEGGYVVAPCSKTTKGAYSIVVNHPIIDLPPEIFKQEKHEYVSYTESVSSEVKISDNNFFAKENFDKNKDDIFDVVNLETRENFKANVISSYPGFGKGQRNDQMTRYIGHVLSRTPEHTWDSEALAIIRAANFKNKPPLPERELLASFESIKRKEREKPPRFTMFYHSSGEQKEWETPEAVEDGAIMLISDVAKRLDVTKEVLSPFGFSIFDNEVMGGLHSGDLVAIGGMPGHGKTTFAMNLTKNFIENKSKVLFFSYEMLIPFVWSKFKMMGISDDSLIYAPLKNVTGNLEWIESKIKEAKEKFGVRIVVIDHLGFLAPKLKNSYSRVSENYTVFLTSIVRELKNIAKEEEVAIILPVHVRKREVLSEKKRNSEIDINDISHTAGVSQESDLVFLVQREYDLRADAREVYTQYSSIRLAKNRHGSKCPKGFFKLQKESFVYEKDYTGVDRKSSALTLDEVYKSFIVDDNSQDSDE